MAGPLPRDSAYRGESPPKKVLRKLFWEEVLGLMGCQFFESRYLVLPSVHAGDVAVLRALGVPPGNIYGVDIDKHAVAAALHRYPNSHFAHCPFWEAFEVFPALKKNLGCVFFDLCCPLRDGVLEQIFNVGERADYVGIEVMYGKEMGAVLDALVLKKGEERQVKPRLDYLQRICHNGVYFAAHKSWHYTSHSEAHFGKPMLASLGQMISRRRVNLTATRIEATLETVKKECMSNPDVAQLYNVSSGTIAAWKASETRRSRK